MTNTTSIQQMLANIVADLVPYYMDAVLLPNQQLISMQMNVEGVSGDQVRIPLTNQYTIAPNVAEGGNIGSADDLTPTAANVAFQKRGVGTDVTEESLEDGGFSLVQQATLTRLAGGLAEATDRAGFLAAKTGFDAAALGEAGSNTLFTTNIVMSPEGMAYVSKREPSISTWYNPNTDVHQFRGTVRNGFTTLRSGFGQRIIARDAVGSANSAVVNVKQIAQSTAILRAASAPTGADGSYVAIISPSYEFAINEQLTSVGGSTVGSLSDLGNNALRNALVNMLAGATIYRSNNLADAS